MKFKIDQQEFKQEWNKKFNLKFQLKFKIEFHYWLLKIKGLNLLLMKLDNIWLMQKTIFMSWRINLNLLEFL
jgi:hypothetical protein